MNLLEVWQNRTALPKEPLILMMRAFTLRCLEAAYRRLDLKDEEIQRLLKGGRLTADRIGRYKQPNYTPVAGITPFFKQFMEDSSTWDRVMIGTVATGGNDWLAALRINTVRTPEGYRMAGIYCGLLRWGNEGLDIQEQIVPAARDAWAEHDWPITEQPWAQARDHLWGAAWHPGDWEGTEDDFIEAIGARMAALVPVLRARGQWRAGSENTTCYARFETLGKVEDARATGPLRGPYQFRFGAREAQLFSGRTHMEATVNDHSVRFNITTGGATLTSCEGAYDTIREVGAILGLRHGDRAVFIPDADGHYTVRRADPLTEDEVAPDAEEADEAPIATLDQILAAFAASPTLVYDPADLINLHHALNALPHKHFVILHGVSGTGKSRFAQAYANALYGRPLAEPDNPHYCLVPVQPTWQDRTPLLGYFNPLTERYLVPDFLAHVLKAASAPGRPYIICLDEMNLAVVEHYFADFLSAWESGEAITLHDQPDQVADLPRRLVIPDNLLVIGTVNIDETTHGFSPKVLDRAFTVELTHVDVRAFGEKLIAQTEDPGQKAVLQKGIDLLSSLHEALAPVGLHFAYRTVEEICRFLITNAAGAPSLPEAQALDLMVVQKVLPKLRGDDRLLPTLEAMRRQVVAHLGEPDRQGAHRTCAALDRMMEDARRYGTFQFWR
ncbi:MAG: hypothetical protein K0R39_1128 [Symbiobacteriaceae bacterium]|jgi:hypothetical protein|nr:hypothetical protein [Symbiobacteriaceae bacterium]